MTCAGMDTLPLELHAQIFECACTDDGTTAHSLSLVSHYVREVSEPYRYQSLAVAGLDSLVKLVHKLEELPTHRRRVHRLFLSGWTHKQTHEKAVAFDAVAADKYDLERSTIVRIFELVAPTLESLSFVAACPYTSTALLGHLFSLRFPRLHDLAVHGFYPFPHVPNAMPRLERLHLSGNRNPYGLLQLGGLAAACPTLRTLHVSGLVAASSFAEELQSMLIPGEHTDPHALSGTVLPPSLRELTLSVGPSPSSARRYASAVARHEKMLERLRSIAGCGESLGPLQVELRGNDGEADAYELLRNHGRDW
ncbi:uncharacterized protein PHACADRAFT_263010 [Phanerochaete carnosa HHB-10118-sp]|uniref:F-box domain-containing protein n=1 Tax=Phanerochaete carnosa (strain HHB-10118-sp) TaxID=650164 RepID=K5WL89_PHACS|nr:uncharacterized protein PHACADRAFT_263010 [Phanerochaete carnosa HHB-10118-sp]EKM51052.1 hypothetical protein PHACADRAFT_263010 [Phanerochaete carnosa HHB-10118-sp]